MVAPVHDVADLAADAHVRARASLTRFEDADLGAVTLVSPTPKLAATPGRHVRPGAPLSAHTDEVLREWLGLDDETIHALRDAGAA